MMRFLIPSLFFFKFFFSFYFLLFFSWILFYWRELEGQRVDAKGRGQMGSRYVMWKTHRINFYFLKELEETINKSSVFTTWKNHLKSEIQSYIKKNLLLSFECFQNLPNLRFHTNQSRRMFCNNYIILCYQFPLRKREKLWSLSA